MVLKDVSLQLYPGELCFLVGRSGSGKTSLLRSLYAALPVTGSKAVVVGHDLLTISSDEVYHLKRSLGIVFQDFKLFSEWSVARNLAFVLYATDWQERDAVSQRIDEVLTAVGLLDKREVMVGRLSGGEQQRLCIARAILNKPSIIIADEPTGSLDKETADEILQLFTQVAALHGSAILLATHSMRLVSNYGARVITCATQTIKE